MFENPFVYWACFLLLPMLLAGLLGALIAWFLRPKHAGDLNVEGEARLRAEADELRAKLRAAEAEQATLVGARETEISDLKGKLAAAAAGAAAAGAATVAATGGKDDEETYALEWRNRYLAARVKYLEGRLAEAPAAKPAKAKAKTTATRKKAAPKKTTAKKSTAKKAAAGAAAATAVAAAAPKARKKPGPKPGTKRGALNKDGTPRKKPGPKPGKAAPAKSAAETALDKYYANVKKYDGRAKRDVVQSIVKYCGVSLKSRDTSLVACSDPKEKDRIVKGFAVKKLGIKDVDARRKLVEDVCTEMKASRQKSRVTFYYLMAKKVGKLDVFGG